MAYRHGKQARNPHRVEDADLNQDVDPDPQDYVDGISPTSAPTSGNTQPAT